MFFIYNFPYSASRLIIYIYIHIKLPIRKKSIIRLLSCQE